MLRSDCAWIPWSALVAAVAVFLVAAPARADDEYIRGYAAAVLERDFNLRADAVSVADGVVTVRGDLPESEGAQLKAALLELEGVRDVILVEGETRKAGWSWLPRRNQFKPLIADPRWPRFAAAYQYYIDDSELSHVAAVSFGEAFPIVQYNPSSIGTWQAGLQAGVFSIFDMASSSFDLVNADYFAALPVSYSLGNFSALGRVFHQSSHLGDEFLLRNRTERINLSYEAIDLLLSYELPAGFRLYGGGGYLMRVDPSGIKPWSLQTGVEYVGRAFETGIAVRPVAAVDVQVNQEGGWDPNVAPQIGVQLGKRRSRTLKILLGYFNGKSPNGQFYERHIQYISLGAQLTL